ncbi:MAG: hydrogenase nickel incorporation protein HypB [Clostridia bacterium]|nr:hydrogenase nickel incorporation protein HypB [Clostridia bacterium]
MDRVKIIDVKKTILEDNDADAEVLRGKLKEQGLLYVNLMSSPGSGKTTTLLSIISRLKDEMRIGVMEADIDSDVDAITIANAGVKSIQLHTGGMCHLDADMSRQGMKELGSDELDLVILENVGNLVCPAEFDTGAQEDFVILSVPEGDDKPLKYPLVFTKCDTVIVNKIDAMPAFNFKLENIEKYVKNLNPDARVFPISAKTGEGVDELCDWIREKVKEQKNNA